MKSDMYNIVIAVEITSVLEELRWKNKCKEEKWHYSRDIFETENDKSQIIMKKLTSKPDIISLTNKLLEIKNKIIEANFKINRVKIETFYSNMDIHEGNIKYKEFCFKTSNEILKNTKFVDEIKKNNISFSVSFSVSSGSKLSLITIRSKKVLREATEDKNIFIDILKKYKYKIYGKAENKIVVYDENESNIDNWS